MFLIILLPWIFIAIGIGFYSRKSGMKFWNYFLISLFFTPIIALIAFAVESAQLRQRRQEALLEKIARQKVVAKPPAPTA